MFHLTGGVILFSLLAQQPAPDPKKDLDTALMKLAIARTQTAVVTAERDLAAAEAAFLKARMRYDTARAEQEKLIAAVPGARPGCVADAAQNLECPPVEEQKKKE